MIFNALMQQRSVATYSGDMLPTVLTRLAFLEQHTLIEVALPGHSRAAVLLQSGWVVHAQYDALVGQAALEYCAAQASQGTLQLYALQDEAAALACAAVDGRLVTASTPHAPGSQAHLEQLRAARFSGVVVRHERPALTALHLVGGTVQGRQVLGEPRDWQGDLTLAWPPRALPRLSVPAARTPFSGPADAAFLSSGLQPPLADDHAVWTHFTAVMSAELGAAADRVIRLMQLQHGNEHGLQLRASLTRQVDRVAGPQIARQFQRQLSRPSAPSPAQESP